MAAKICTACGIRRVATGKWSGYEDREYCADHDYCYPCGDEGQMDNNHHNGHEVYAEDICWGCHPELDESKKAKKASSKTTGNKGPRRPQLRHAYCTHERTPEGRRECRKAFWAFVASEGYTEATVLADHFVAWYKKQEDKRQADIAAAKAKAKK
jgi:hypothetical protein